ncbi:MAG: HAMP domain-containing sensor histidine kinase [Gemmatimonadota bacterium]
MDRTTLAFLGGLAHELRTPLGAIGGYAELMELGVHGPVSPAQIDGLGRIRRNQALMVSLLNAFMAYAEVAAGDVELAPTAVSLRSALHDAIASLATSADARSIRVELLTGALLSTQDVTLHVDPDALDTLLVEVLRDAVESSPIGGEVRVSLSAGDGRSRIEVQGSGEAIDAEGAEAAFRPFDRDGKGGRTSASPHALSLPHARLLARLLGGDVEAVTSSPLRTVIVDLVGTS